MNKINDFLKAFTLTRLLLASVCAAVVLSFNAKAQTIPSVPSIRSSSPAYELERTKETLRSRAVDAKIQKVSDEYRKENQEKISSDKEDKKSADKAGEQKIMYLKRLIFDKSDLLSDDFLENIASRYQGKQVGLSDIKDIIAEVDEEYKKKGFYAAKAYVPNQDIKDKILKVNLIEGKVNKINVKDNKSTNEKFVRSNIGVKSGDYLNIKEVQDNILMFNAANDIKTRIAMAPGDAFATTDLDVIVEEPERVSVSAFVDNAGQKSTGLYRAGAIASIRSLTGYRDNLNLGGVVSEGSNAFFGSFDIPEPILGSRIGVGMDYSDTEIVGGDLRALDVTGNFYNYYFYIKRPVYVTDSFVNNVNFTTNFKNGASYIGDFRTQKVYTDSWSLSWDSLKLFAGGYFYNQLSVTNGVKLIDGDTEFWRFNYNGEFHYNIWDNIAYNVKAKAQYSAQSFLPSSEQFQIGGVNSVRGYTEGMLVGDKGFAIMNEFQYDVKPLLKDSEWLSSAKVYAFFDFGHVYAKDSNNLKNENDALIYSTGVGARLGLLDRVDANVTLAFPLKEHNYYETDRDVELLFFVQTKLW